MTNRIVKVVFRGDVSGLVGPVVAAGKAVGDTANNLTAAGKESEKFRRGLTTLGGTAGKVGLVAAAGLGVAIKASSDFNAQMALVKTLSHASSAEMDRLSHAALTVGQNIGYSAKSVAQGEEELIKAGVSVNDILGGALKGSLNLAAAGQTDLATATQIAAAAMTEFQLKGKDIPHLADLLAAGADKALGSVEDLGQGLTQVGTTAHQMGLNVDQTVGTLAAFAQAGLIGERGGTTFKQMLLQLAAPTTQAQKLMDKYGISLYNAAGQMKTMPELADNLQAGLGKISPQARNAALGVIFGSRAIQGANILMADGQKGIQEWITKVNDQGFAAHQASGKLDSLAGDFSKLKAAMQTAFIGLGQGSQSPLRALTQDATAALNVFNELPGSLKGIASDMLLITAVTGGGLWFGSRVIKSVADTRAALATLGVDAAKTRIALTGLTRGIEFVAIIEGVNLLDKSLQSLLHENLDTSKLAGDLQTLGETGQVTGTLAKTFGPDMAKFGKYAEVASSGISKLTSKLYGFLPGDTSLDIAKRNIKGIDDQLAQMVGAGNGDQAAAIFNDLAAAADKQGVSVSKLQSLMPAYTGSLVAGSGAAKLMSDAMTGLIAPTDGVTGATGPMGTAVQQSAADLEAQAKALEESRKAASETAQQFAGLGSKLNNSKVSLNGWIKDLAKQAAALRDFTKNAQTAGKKGLDEGLIASLEKAGPEGALRLKQLADASEKEIRRANRAWASQQRAIDAYVNTVGGVPPAVTTTLDLHASAAEAALARIMHEITQIPKSWRTDYYVVQHNAISKPRVLPGNPGGTADGGTIHAASGWTVPGERYPYGDKVHAFLAPGEEVITNRHGEADRFRADRAAGRIPAYGDGGTTSRYAMAYTSPSVAASTGGGGGFDYGRLASAAGGDRRLGYRDTRNAHIDALRTVLREMPVQRVASDPGLMYGAGS